MPVATIQITQGGVVGGSGQSVIGLTVATPVTLTDDGGAGATSYLWECLSWPGPLVSAPVITNSTSQVATFTPPLDGLYLFKLTRVQSGVTTTDTKFCGCPNDYGLYIPSSGCAGAMFNLGASPTLAIAAGWMGRKDATTNVFLDAILRLLLGRTAKGEYGDGSDGSLSMIIDVTATADKQYDVLTTNAHVYYPSGFRIFGKTKVTVSAGGKVSNNGGDGSAYGGASSGALSGTLGGGGAGGNSFADSGGGAGNGSWNSYGGGGGDGGSGQSTGGLGGTITPPGASSGNLHSLPNAVLAVLSWQSVTGGAGGGGGSGSMGMFPPPPPGEAGGGGGGGAGVIGIYTTWLQLDGTIEAIGGGGAGAASYAWVGDGGSGGGGLVILVYGRKTGSNPTNILVGAGTVTRGKGSGNIGTVGSPGLVIELVHQ